MLIAFVIETLRWLLTPIFGVSRGRQVFVYTVAKWTQLTISGPTIVSSYLIGTAHSKKTKSSE
jgi:hypothetical protein